MNYYQHHLGDYAKDTGHLSLLEHGAYRLLLDHYYSTEKPLPKDVKMLCRICGSQNQKERAAVKLVSERFFTLDGDVLRNKRADEEISKVLAMRERNAENGKHGGRPKKTQSVSSGFGLGNPDGNPEKSLSNNQYPITSIPPNPPMGGTRAQKPPSLCDDDWLASLATNPAYSGIDIAKELGRAKAWADTNRRQCSRKFFVNWLNRVEKPIAANGAELPPSKRY